MTSAALSSFLQALVVLGSALTALKLFTTGLYKQYPVFFVYFLFRIPNSLWPLILDVRSDTYFYAYIYTIPLVLAFYILLMRETYRLVLQDYKGLATAGRWAMYVSVLGAILISVLTLLPKIKPSMAQRSKVMGIVVGAERGVDTALVVFLILLLAILSRYPIKLRRNVRVNAFVFAIYFLSMTMGLLARSYLGMKNLGALNTVMTVVNVCAVFAWLLLLSPSGEEVAKPKSGNDKAALNERRLLLQLEGLNAALLRVSRQKVG